jgi:hypothetical protein
MMEEIRSGSGVLYRYDLSEMANGLEQHPQLTRDLWHGAYATFRKALGPGGTEEFRFEIIQRGRELSSGRTRDVAELVEKFLDAVERHAPDDFTLPER